MTNADKVPINFSPVYTITPKMAGFLLRIEAAKEKILHLPLTPTILASLRESARLYTTHYSTMIEGNRLEVAQVKQVIERGGRFKGRAREEGEVKGYYAALQQLEKWAAKKSPVTEAAVQTLHALVVSRGKTRVKPTPYRDGQNVIRDSRTSAIVYMPPEANDVPSLMQSLVRWINKSNDVPTPILGAIAHYQFATIHPYYDGNGRTARLLTTLLLHLGGYDLKGLYSLEEYYAHNLHAYYDAIDIGPSHNYYRGRASADITKWVEYFIEGMAVSFEKVLQQMSTLGSGKKDHTKLLHTLDPKKRKALELFSASDIVTSTQIGELFGFKPRTSSQLCKDWVESRFLEIADFSNKGRKYRLAKKYRVLVF
jgi:Fic family protein